MSFFSSLSKLTLGNPKTPVRLWPFSGNVAELYRLLNSDPPGSASVLGSRLLSTTSRVSRRKRSSPTSFDSDELRGIIELIRRDTTDAESKLARMDLMLSHDRVSEILRNLNDESISALRFFNWVLSSHPGFSPSSAIYNLIVENLGRLDDYNSMFRVLSELSSKGHCLSEKAFGFLAVRRSTSINNSVKRVAEMLNRVGGSCRGSGTYMLIRFLCGLGRYDLAILVMEETGRRTSYYNVLIAAKCRNGDFQAARDVLDEMRRYGTDPNTSSYNYLLGTLFKSKRVVEGCELLQTMEDLGYHPDLVTFEVVMHHACQANRMDLAIDFLERMFEEGLKPRFTTHAAFIKGYFWSGRVEEAYRYVVDMSVKDKHSSNANYSLLANLLRMSGRVVEAGRVLHEMMAKGLKPNFPVYIKVMKDLHNMTRRDLALQLEPMFLEFDASSRIS